MSRSSCYVGGFAGPGPRADATILSNTYLMRAHASAPTLSSMTRPLIEVLASEGNDLSQVNGGVVTGARHQIPKCVGGEEDR